MALSGFEDINPDLSDYEMTELLPAMLPAFEKKIGKGKIITGATIAKAMKLRGFKCSGIRVRKIINYIRKKGLILGLIATSKGYYISEDKQEIKKYIESLDGRINEIDAVRKTFLDYHRTLK